MNTRRTLRPLAATVALAAVVTLAPAASAETTRIDDGADATASTTDIRVVRVNHADARVRVRVGFPDLREDGQAGLLTYFDTDPSEGGPEYAIGAPLFSGGDYVLVKTDRWRTDGRRVSCRYNLQLDYAADRLTFTARRGCFDAPAELRVAMRMVDGEAASPPVRDWLIGRRDFTDWVAAG